MQITATFESIEEMQSFARQIAGETDEPVKAEKPEVKQVKAQKLDPQVEPRGTQEHPNEPEPQATEETGAGQEETAYTLEEVRAKLAELQKAGKRAEVKELLGSFGVAKLSELPPAKYAVLMVKAGEL